MNNWEKWIISKQTESTMEVTAIDLSEIRGWETDSKSVHKPDNSFFRVIGINIAPTVQREIKSWDQPALEETGEGAIVLAFSKIKKVLLQAKAEPGNDSKGHVLLAPTLQASKSNLETAHGGKKPPRAELVSKKTKWTAFCQDGGRYLKKRNNYAIVEADTVLPTINERWFTIFELKQAIQKGYANEHLLQAYALLTTKKIF
jgi:oxidase EvaA